MTQAVPALTRNYNIVAGAGKIEKGIRFDAKKQTAWQLVGEPVKISFAEKAKGKVKAIFNSE
jgi:hypothetical protein